MKEHPNHIYKISDRQVDIKQVIRFLCTHAGCHRKKNLSGSRPGLVLSASSVEGLKPPKLGIKSSQLFSHTPSALAALGGRAQANGIQQLGALKPVSELFFNPSMHIRSCVFSFTAGDRLSHTFPQPCPVGDIIIIISPFHSCPVAAFLDYCPTWKPSPVLPPGCCQGSGRIGQVLRGNQCRLQLGILDSNDEATKKKQELLKWHHLDSFWDVLFASLNTIYDLGPSFARR